MENMKNQNQPSNIKFRIYYAEGETYTGDPFNAPALGVMVIVENDPANGRRLVSAKDYYVWDENEERWWAVDYIGMVDYLIMSGRKRVLFGRTIESEKWYAIMREANNDPAFQPRTGWGNKEEQV